MSVLNQSSPPNLRPLQPVPRTPYGAAGQLRIRYTPNRPAAGRRTLAGFEIEVSSLANLEAVIRTWSPQFPPGVFSELLFVGFDPSGVINVNSLRGIRVPGPRGPRHVFAPHTRVNFHHR